MKIVSADFVKSITNVAQLPKLKLPEIAFAGRSNVGKSSLLNSLLGRKRLAHISTTPGKTQYINFYVVNNQFYFVDLPGYGFARAAKTLQQSWKRLIENYILTSFHLRLIILLIDIRHHISELDLKLIEWLLAYEKPFCLVCTKADKLSGNQLQTQKRNIIQRVNDLGIEKLLTYSVKTGHGKGELWRVIRDNLEIE